MFDGVSALDVASTADAIPAAPKANMRHPSVTVVIDGQAISDPFVPLAVVAVVSRGLAALDPRITNAWHMLVASVPSVFVIVNVASGVAPMRLPKAKVSVS